MFLLCAKDINGIGKHVSDGIPFIKFQVCYIFLIVQSQSIIKALRVLVGTAALKRSNREVVS